MKNIVKFYFNFNDYIENRKEILDQIQYEGYKWLLSYPGNDGETIVIMTLI